MLQLLTESERMQSWQIIFIWHDGRIVASLVRAQPLPFLLNILRWLLVAIPATACNSLLSYIQNKLAIAYRTRLTEEVMKQYLGNEEDQSKIFYKMCTQTLSLVIAVNIQVLFYSQSGWPNQESGPVRFISEYTL